MKVTGGAVKVAGGAVKPGGGAVKVAAGAVEVGGGAVTRMAKHVLCYKYIDTIIRRY